MRFALDATVALSWLLDDAGAGQAYAVATFDALTRTDAEAFVPATWSLEIADVIAKSEARGILLPSRSQAFLSALAAAPIECDGDTHLRALSDTLALDVAQHGPVVIRRQSRDQAVLVSPQEYARLRGIAVKDFDAFCNRIGEKAVKRGLTERKLAALLRSDA